MTHTFKNQLFFALIGIALALCFTFFGMQTFILVGGLVFIYLSFLNPNYSLGLLIIAIPFIEPEYMLMVMLMVIFFYGLHYINEGRTHPLHYNIQGFLLLFVVLVIFTTFFSVSIKASQRDFILHILSLGILFVMINREHTKKDIHILYVCFIGAGIISAVYGIYQMIIRVPMGSGWVDPSINPNVVSRVYATFENPNIFALFLLFVLPITLSLFYTSKKIESKIIFGTSWLLMVMALVFTFSRGGYLAFSIGLLLFIILTNPKNIIGLTIIGVLSIPLLPPVIWERILTIGSATDSSNYYRLVLWNGAFDMIQDYWHLGTGLGYASFREVVPRYFSEMSPYHLHNTFLQFFVETGVLGITLLILLILMIIKITLKVIGNEKDNYVKNTTAALLAAFVSIFIHGMFEHLLFNPKIIVYFWILIGLILINYKFYKSRGKL
ncbi:O-antigen ligase-like membrane protein [Natranaerovirga hydrolytica]|uniref:O-antigen ligase-like membrane protein n=1 Tax=Natranaerovirga hydrolytica TaxID=680378 RepID=A0A4V2Q0E2_9FIRM|nr:O-antigen ligase family protein [Natranaerovirga hydrolytica]TCK93461.1 O-antigen ligase-like membrane protein [Natranaerovirga hydrolytica]